PPDDRRQLARHAPPRDRGVGDGAEALLGDVVDDVEDAKTPAAGELVVDEVDRPACVRLSLDEDRRPRAGGLAARPPLAHREPLFTIEPVDAVDARQLAFP